MLIRNLFLFCYSEELFVCDPRSYLFIAQCTGYVDSGICPTVQITVKLQPQHFWSVGIYHSHRDIHHDSIERHSHGMSAAIQNGLAEHRSWWKNFKTNVHVFALPASLVTKMVDLSQANQQLQKLVSGYNHGVANRLAAATCVAANSNNFYQHMTISYWVIRPHQCCTSVVPRCIYWMRIVNDCYQARLNDTIKTMTYLAGNMLVANVMANMSTLWLTLTINPP